MGLADRLLSAVEDRLGLTVVERERLDRLQESQQHLERFMEEANELAYHALDYFGGKPQDLRPERRARLSQRSRVALMEDPLAGAEANLLANFAFGRGVSMPEAANEKVQEIIEEAWNDPVNRQKLTGFEAQRHRSNELLTQANLYPVAFVRNGRVRLAFLDADCVTAVVTDPEDEERPFYYLTRKRRVEWDFENDRVLTTDEMKEGGLPKVVYYEHWRNVADARREAEENGEEPPKGPPEDKLAEGLVEHIRINRIGRTQFGTPPWARTLRFYSALNKLTTAHVAMAQAASSIIAKQVVKGGENEVTRMASNLLSQTGELAAARFGAGVPPADIRERLPVPPGSFGVENESARLEAVNLNSGAAQMLQTAQIVRSPIAAASGFGPHYLGDPSSSNLATATSLELPTLMNVQAWQETFEELFRWFINLVIQEAVRAGRLGGYDAALAEEGVDARSAGKPLSELVYEDDRAEMERRTGLDLSYSFEMPYPGRRNLPDVVSLVTTVSASMDPHGQNVPLRRALLGFLAKHGMQLADPQAWVDEVLPEEAALMMLNPERDPETGNVVTPEQGGGPGGRKTPEQKEDPSRGDGVKRARTGRPAQRSRRGDMSEQELEALFKSLGAETAGLFEDAVVEPLLAGASRNGSG